MAVQQLLGGAQIAGRRLVHALALDGLDHEGGDVPLLQLPCQGVEITERYGRVGQQRCEAVPEAVLAVHGERAGGEPVEGVVAVQDARSASGVPGELQRGLDCLRAAVAEEHPVQVRAVAEQLLGEQPGQRLAVEAGQVGEVRVEHVVQRLADHGVVAAEPHHPEPGEHVQVVVAVRVPEVRALGPLVDLVEADGVQHARELVVEVPGVEFVALGAALGQESAEVELLGTGGGFRGGHFTVSPRKARLRTGRPRRARP